MALGLLGDLYQRGWRDPTKIHLPSAELAILITDAKTSLAKHLKISPNEIEVISDLNLGFHLGISGLLHSNSRLIHSAVDRQDIFAIARAHQNNGGEIQVCNCNLAGVIDYAAIKPSDNNVIVWQSCNRETGVKQSATRALENISTSGTKIFADMTFANFRSEPPVNWSTALWDATSWGGPKGIAFLAIRNGVNWVNPLPHIDMERVSNGFSIPLFLASVVALENSDRDFETDSLRILELNKRVRGFVAANISDADIAGNIEDSDPRKLSISFLYVQAEELLRNLEKSGYLVDSGSACSAADLAPSHVLAAMGVLTHGNIRLTFRADLTIAIVDQFLTALKTEIERARLD
jgi:cysteine desulfurase